ncbi:MAG: SDR family oxidoreductase [Coriobacteriia bacterium]|nr:SDR family oxidoreductase [Coriobacteriia bacterium]
MNPNPAREEHLVLMLGGTGRTGGRVLKQLLDRGVRVRAIVRSAGRLPEGVAGNPLLTVTEAEPLSLSAEEMLEQVRGCDAIISCLGHTNDLKGVFGAPHELVTPMVERACAAAVALQPTEPIRIILMSTVSVYRPGALDARRGGVERALTGLLRALVPPAKDNQDAADFLLEYVGTDSPFVGWVVIRPDTLVDSDVTEYALHEGIVSSLAKPDDTSRANVAHFMCDLVTEPSVWKAWRGGMPVIVNAAKA